MALFRKTGFRPPAKVSCSMTLERVPTWTALVFTQRRWKLKVYFPTDSVSPCWHLKNTPARVEESRCSPQCCFRMVKILPGVLMSSVPMDSTFCLAWPSSALMSQPAAAGSAMGWSWRKNCASRMKSPSSPENWHSMWGLKLCSVSGAGVCWVHGRISAVVLVMTGLESLGWSWLQCQVRMVWSGRSATGSGVKQRGDHSRFQVYSNQDFFRSRQFFSTLKVCSRTHW